MKTQGRKKKLLLFDLLIFRRCMKGFSRRIVEEFTFNCHRLNKRQSYWLREKRVFYGLDYPLFKNVSTKSSRRKTISNVNQSLSSFILVYSSKDNPTGTSASFGFSKAVFSSSSHRRCYPNWRLSIRTNPKSFYFPIKNQLTRTVKTSTWEVPIGNSQTFVAKIFSHFVHTRKKQKLINLLILGKLNSINSIQHHRLTYFYFSNASECSPLFVKDFAKCFVPVSVSIVSVECDCSQWSLFLSLGMDEDFFERDFFELPRTLGMFSDDE